MTTASTVFVIHGHNHAAKDAMFAFLRALNLQPLEWDQAVSLTRKALPYTFEVVQAGLGAAQCVVVLLTGDDMTGPIGRPGAEMPQPRPNVLVEMGMALAKAGPERTVLVRFEELQAVSDIAGLNSILLSNDPEARQALVARLRLAGCDLDNSGSHYLSPERGGDFSTAMMTARSSLAPSQASEQVYFSSFGVSDSVPFRSYAESAIRKASRIVLIGVGLNILHQDPFADEVFQRAARGECHLEIYLADPSSPAIESRLIEEEMGQHRPPVGHTGLERRLSTLVQLRNRLNKPDTTKLCLFSDYPTFALMIIDDEYFIYPYGTATIGNFSPVLRFSQQNAADRNVIAFLNRQYDMVVKRSIDAELSLLSHTFGGLQGEPLHSLAFYVVPPASSPFYEFGCEILGYDVRKRAATARTSRWANHVGSALPFGFHLTVCDALHFFTSTRIEMAVNETEYLLQGLRPFWLTNLRVAGGVPDLNSVSVVAEDPSGTLHVLHNELVHRVYRSAAASNYTLGSAPLVRDQSEEQSRLLMSRYRAPYVLHAFQLHFTLLAMCSPADQPAIVSELDELLGSYVPQRRVEVNTLAWMAPQGPNRQWGIERELAMHRWD